MPNDIAARSFRIVAQVVLIAALLGVHPLAAQNGPPPEERAAIDALLAMLDSQGDDALLSYAEARMAPAYRASFAQGGLLEHLRAIRTATEGALGGVGVDMDDEGLLVELSDQRTVMLRLVFNDTFQVTRLEVHDAADSEGGPRGAVAAHFDAIEGLGRRPLETFPAEHFTPGLRAQLNGPALQEMLERARESASSSGMMDAQVVDGGYLIRFRGGTLDADVYFEVEADEPYLISSFSVDTDVEPAEQAPVEVLAWNDLDRRFTQAMEAGFAGSVLAIRDGQTILQKSYGLADRRSGRANTNESIYEIGSLPIDFTRAAVLLLMQRGAIDLDAPISRYFPNVPADKQTLTVRHLMTGASGLPNFHHLASDSNRDLGVIDRTTAEERILSSHLLFPPGEGSANSHSAFTLLAALVERASGMTYLDFLQTNFFDPAGMTSTGATGDDLGHPLEQFSTGYGGSSVGDPNIPPNWPRTSWLSMGSGVMVSNPADMHRWFETLRSGRILTGEALSLYLARRHAIGGSDRGFLFVHAWAGGDSMIFMAQNAGNQTPEGDALMRALLALVNAGGQ